MKDYKKGPVVFALDSTKRFGYKVGVNGKHIEKNFPDDEPFAKPGQDIRGCDVFVIQSLHNYGDNGESIGDKLLKLSIFCNAAHHASAKRITAVIPYLGLSRQDRKASARDPLSAQSLAMTLEANYVNRLLTMDPHNLAIQSAYRIPSDILSPLRPFVDFLVPYMKKYKKVTLLSPDYGAMKERVAPLEDRILKYFNDNPPFELITGVTDKSRKSGSSIKSRGIIVFGKIDGSLVIIPDDESLTGDTIVNSAGLAKKSGAAYVIGTIVHNKLNDEKAMMVQKAKSIDMFVVTDTIYRPPEFFEKYTKFKELSVAPYFKKAIRNIHDEKSLSEELF